MIQTQLLQLQPPYQVIYCGGEVGLHVGTLIVACEQLDERGLYLGIETHSYPVVSYTNKARSAGFRTHRFAPYAETGEEGVVWNRAELRDVYPLCLGTDERVALQRIDWLRGEFSIPVGGAGDLPSLYHIAARLSELGIAIELPEKEEMEVPQVLVYVQGEAGEPLYVYGMSKTAVFYTPWASVAEIADRIGRQSRDYEQLYLGDDQPHITFCLDKELSYSDFCSAEGEGTLDEQYMAIDPEIREGMEQLVQRLNSGDVFPF